MDHEIILPSKPRIVNEEGNKGIYEIDGLYPGYGYTLGNSLRRIILSSLSGAGLTMVKIEGVSHEFSTIEGMKEDIIVLLLNLRNIRFKLSASGPQAARLKAKGVQEIVAGDISLGGQVEILNPELHIASLTSKNASLDMEMTIEQGLGYVPKEMHHKDKLEIGAIALDAVFTPIRRVNYEIENMRVGDRTDYNRLRIFVETDGSLSPREALERSIATMIKQLSAIVGFQVESVGSLKAPSLEKAPDIITEDAGVIAREAEVLKTRVEDLDISARTQNALRDSGIRTVGGLARKREEDLLNIAGLGEKAITEIKKVLGNLGITLRQ